MSTKGFGGRTLHYKEICHTHVAPKYQKPKLTGIISKLSDFTKTDIYIFFRIRN